MQTTTKLLIAVVACAVGASGAAYAQPAQPPPADPAGDEPADPWPDDAGDPDGPDDPPIAQPVAPRAQPEPLVGAGGFQRPVLPALAPIDHPKMFSVATGYLLPAGVIMTSLGVDTGGGVTSDTRIGLGDVAEFGFETTDQIATVDCQGDSCGELDAVQPYPLAQFRMGVNEEQLFLHQPALTLGFRKSFTREHDGRKTRVAELYLSASKKLGDRARVHAGGVFWDAGVRRIGQDNEILLHDKGVGKQLRAFGGIELQPKDRSTLLIELGWAPEFRLREVAGQSDSIHLRPTLSWGVRFEFAKWGVIESGVRIPDIKDINLLDAQIFGQLKLISRRFERFLDGLR